MTVLDDARIAVAPAGPADGRAATLRRALVGAAVATPPVVVAGLVVAGLPDYARLLVDEQSPITWLQTVLLVVAGVLAGLLAARRWLAGDRLHPWSLLAAGFVWLALDDRFLIHERLRDDVLAGRVPDVLPWGKSGDVVLLAYAVGGLVLTRSVLRALHDDRTARVAFVAALGLLGLAAGIDSVDPASLTRSEELAESTVEESLELFGDAAFVLALALPAVAAEAPTAARSHP